MNYDLEREETRWTHLQSEGGVCVCVRVSVCAVSEWLPEHGECTRVTVALKPNQRFPGLPKVPAFLRETLADA